MPITQSNGTTVATGKGVDVFRFLSVRGTLKLEKMGLKHSGGPLRPRLAKEFGLKPRDSHDMYIAKCQELIDAAHAADVKENTS